MFPPFDFQPTLKDSWLELRPLAEGDLLDLYVAGSNPKTWAGHPLTDRYQREVFEPYAKTLLESGGTLVVIDRTDGRIIGCSRYYVSPDQLTSISIGFTFVHHSHWGGTTNFRLKRLMSDHASLTFREVWFHISPVNIRSQRATRKLGAEHAGDKVLNLSGQPMHWMWFRLSKETWQQRNHDETASREAGS